MSVEYNLKDKPLINLFYNTHKYVNTGVLLSMIKNAWKYDKLTTYKILSYIIEQYSNSDDNRITSIIIKWLANNDRCNLIRNIKHITSKYGKESDMLFLLDTECDDWIYKYVEYHLKLDVDHLNKGKQVSQLAKWIPSENKKIDKETNFYIKLANYMKISPRKLRQLYIAPLRSHLRTITNNQPISKSSSEDILPKDIIKKYVETDMKNMNDELEHMWKKEALIFKNEFSDDIERVIMLCDTSPSMCHNMMYISIAINILISEHSNYIYDNLFLTYEKTPKLYEIKGDTLFQKIQSIKKAPWDMTFNLSKALKLILRQNIINNISDDDTPKTIIVLTDVYFDQSNNTKIINFIYEYEEEKIMFNHYGYTIPKIVFWNLKAGINNDNNLFYSNTEYIRFVNGYSPEILKSILKNKPIDAWINMYRTINSNKYNNIHICN